MVLSRDRLETVSLGPGSEGPYSRGRGPALVLSKPVLRVEPSQIQVHRPALLGRALGASVLKMRGLVEDPHLQRLHPALSLGLGFLVLRTPDPFLVGSGSTCSIFLGGGTGASRCAEEDQYMKL